MDLDAEVTRIRNRIRALEDMAGVTPSPAGQPFVNSLAARLSALEANYRALAARISALEKGPGASSSAPLGQPPPVPAKPA